MKKISITALLLIIVFSILSAVDSIDNSGRFPTLVTIGDGEESNFVPIYPYYCYSYTQSLYLQNEINQEGKRIEKLSYYWNGAGTNAHSKDWVIYMGHTPLNNLTNFLPISEMTLAFSGEVNAPASPGWVSIDLDTPFAYNNVDNLVIAVDENTNDYDGNAQFFHSTTISSRSSLYYYSDTVNPDPASPPYPSYIPAIPNTRLLFFNIPTNPILSLRPSTIDFGIVHRLTPSAPKELTVSNMGTGTLVLNSEDLSISGTYANYFSFDESVFPIELEGLESATIPIEVFSPIVGDISATLTVSYGTINYDIQLIAEVWPTGLVEIGSGNQNLNLPINPYFGYSYSQSLYLSSQINMVNKQIEQISYYWNGVAGNPRSKDWVIYMAHTPQNTLSEYIPYSQLTQVFAGQVICSNTEGWVDIELDTPFLYNGVDNLVIAVDENTVGYDEMHQFFLSTSGFPNRSLRFYSDSENPNPLNPPTPTAVNGFPNIRMILLDPPSTPVFQHTPHSLDFGIVSYGHHSAPLSVNITNSGGGTLTLNASDISFSGMAESMFSFPLDDFPLNLNTGQQYSLPITLHSTQEGALSAIMTIHYDDVNYDIPLRAVSTAENIVSIQIGSGTDTNGNNAFPAPYGSYTRAFREQYLYRASELLDYGVEYGLLSALAWKVHSTQNCFPMPNYRIRLKHTQQESLNSSFEEGDYTTVCQYDSYSPTTDWNIHQFDSPFLYNGVDNLIIEVISDLIDDHNSSHNAQIYLSNIPFPGSLRFQSNQQNGGEGISGTTIQKRPNISLFRFDGSLGSLSGTITEGGFPLGNARISIQNSSFSTLSNADGSYSFPHLPTGTHQIIASKYGFTEVSHIVSVSEGENTIQDFILSGSPEFSIDSQSFSFGEVYVGGYRKKTITITNLGGGELSLSSINGSDALNFRLQNIPPFPHSLRSEQSLSFDVIYAPLSLGMHSSTISVHFNMSSRPFHELVAFGSGSEHIHIGAGDELGRTPVDLIWRTSVFETIIPADELGNFTGSITGLKLYNNFGDTFNNIPVKIWLGATELSDLSAGWISASLLNLVFNGPVNFPAGQNTISIDFDQVYNHPQPENLVVLVQHPYEMQIYISTVSFKCQTVGTNRSRDIYSSDIIFDPSYISGGTLSGRYPKFTFQIVPGGVGHIIGTVYDESGSPLPNVDIALLVRNSFVQSDENGEFEIRNLIPGLYELSFSKHGYQSYTAEIDLHSAQEYELNVNLSPLPKVDVFGLVYASDTALPLSDARISLMGYDSFSTTTLSDGSFSFDSSVYAQNSYFFTISAGGYSNYSGSIEIGDTDYDMGQITLNEVPYAPTEVFATITEDQSAVNITWNAPDPDAFELRESFEDALFPPAGWTQLITNTQAPNSYGLSPTWCRISSIDGIQPSLGQYQAGLGWVAYHQDEWLYTPAFICPPDAYLSFDTHLMLGSDGGDHYYVKVSNDNGNSWSELWDGSAQAAGLNNYSQPITLDLSQYSGQQIKIAFNADDGADAMGLWHNWFIDNIYIGNAIRTASPLPLFSAALQDKGHSRAFVGYRVYRLESGTEALPESWTLISDGTHIDTSIMDSAWQGLSDGDYLWAVHALYDAEVLSLPVFSNSLNKVAQFGNISGFVRRSDTNSPISGATITAGETYATTSSANGFYNLYLPIGSYTVSASHGEYQNQSFVDIIVLADETTTLNFNLMPTSNENLTEIAATILKANYPNPFNPQTTIAYDLEESSKVRLDVYNLKGQLVRTLVAEQQLPGRYQILFDAKDSKGNSLSSGIYLYRFRAGDYSATRKMMLLE